MTEQSKDAVAQALLEIARRMPSEETLRTDHPRYYAPQFVSDREWYEHTRFRGEEGWIGRGSDCFTTGTTWPLGKWLDAPFRRGRP